MTDEVARRLAETIAWCDLHARADDAGVSTRSPALRPPVMALPQRQRLPWLLDRPGEPQVAVEAVCGSPGGGSWRGSASQSRRRAPAWVGGGR